MEACPQSTNLFKAQKIPVVVDYDPEISDLIQKMGLAENAVDRKIFSELTKNSSEGKGKILLNLRLLELTKGSSLTKINDGLLALNLAHAGNIELINLGIHSSFLHENSTFITALGSHVTFWGDEQNGNSATKYYYCLVGRNRSSYDCPRRLHLLQGNGFWPKGCMLLTIPRDEIEQLHV